LVGEDMVLWISSGAALPARHGIGSLNGYTAYLVLESPTGLYSTLADLCVDWLRWCISCKAGINGVTMPYEVLSNLPPSANLAFVVGISQVLLIKLRVKAII